MSVKDTKYFYNITGERARELLFLYGKKSEFIVRPSESNPSDYTLSVHRGSRVTHVKIPYSNGKYRLPTGEEFQSLCSLVTYLIKTPNLLSERDGAFIELTRPVNIPLAESVVSIGYDRFFHIQITGVEAEDLLKDEPNGTYLVRESTSNPGEYALSVKNEDMVIHVRIYYSDGKFRVVPKDRFRSLSDLLDNYFRLPMVQNGGSVVRLKAALLSTRFTAATIDDRIDCLTRSAKKLNAKDGIVEEFEGIHREKDSHLFISCKEGRKPENVRKNRYRNVVPYDHTRIVLRVTDGEQHNDYINANRIEVLADCTKYHEFKGFQRRYISTQGCLQETVGDFWRMVWQEESRVIVMITKEVERGRVKCFRYWAELGDELRVSTSPTQEITVKTVTEDICSDFVRRVFFLSNKASSTTPRKVFHLQFLGWEDNDACPVSAVLNFMENVDACIDDPDFSNSQNSSGPRGPTVVHCSAGIGRTGTFIVLDILINRIKQIGPNCLVDVQKTVRMLREQRATMVQTETQYRFIYHAISEFMKMYRVMHQNDPGELRPRPSAAMAAANASSKSATSSPVALRSLKIADGGLNSLV